MSQFQRFELLIGEKFKNVAAKTVLILGLGGVGSYACESLIRSGIGNIIIVDNDVIDITNLNRQLMSDHNNIGKSKIDVWVERIKRINPEYNIASLFKHKIDYFIDACDTINTKVLAIKNCLNKHIKIISCMGTGNKMDPSKLQIMDLSKTKYDRLAKIMRKKLNDEGIKYVKVVCSDEKPYTKVTKEIPSNSFVPATAGLLITSYVINDIVGDNNV